MTENTLTPILDTIIRKRWNTMPTHVTVGYLLATALLVSVASALLIGYQPLLLKHWQQSFVYKQASGFLLLAYLLLQWRLAKSRIRQERGRMGRVLAQHKVSAVLGPLLCYLHASSPGYGFQSILMMTFLLCLLTGCLNREFLGITSRSYGNAWMVMHVNLATATLILLGCHVYVVYFYR